MPPLGTPAGEDQAATAGVFLVFVWRAADFSPRGLPGADARVTSPEVPHDNQLRSGAPVGHEPFFGVGDMVSRSTVALRLLVLDPPGAPLLCLEHRD